MRIIVYLLLSFTVTAGVWEQYAVSSEMLPPAVSAGEVIDEPNDVLTLRQVLALTLMNNPELKVFSLEIRAADARALQAGLRPNPELQIEVEDVGGSGARSGFDAAETTIQLSQLIELGDKAQKRRKAASLEKELADWDYQAKRLEVLTGAGKAYVELLAIQEKAKLLAELVGVSERTIRSVSQRVEAGKDSPLEKTKASVALSVVQLEHRQTLQELETARKIAASFWGDEQPKFVRAQGHLPTVTDIPGISDLQQILMQNPQLARWEKEIARGKANLDLAKSKTIPDISINAGIKRFNESNDNAVVFGVTIPLPISDRNQGGRMEAAYNLSKSYEEQRAARIAVLNKFNQIYAELSLSLNKIKDLRASILPGAREVFEASQNAYTEGKIDYLNVLDAQRTYFLSQMDYIETLVSYHKAKTDMEGLIGQSIDTAKTLNK
ncbi:MAG: TolC family protein [Candidatus Brocadiia bacterium]|nr:MAG: TolC family protein [Candidatus Brocadiia bacterium]